VAVAALVGGIDALADLTQDRPDSVVPGSRSEIVLEVRSRDRTGSDRLSAQGLWGACQGTVWQKLLEPGVIELADGRFRLTTEPALGEHSWRRLQGCPRRGGQDGQIPDQQERHGGPEALQHGDSDTSTGQLQRSIPFLSVPKPKATRKTSASAWQVCTR